MCSIFRLAMLIGHFNVSNVNIIDFYVIFFSGGKTQGTVLRGPENY